MGLGDPLGDRQTEASPTDAAFLVGNPVEAFEDMRQALCRDAFARIGDRSQHFLPLATETNLDFAAGLVVLNGVCEQVEDDLLQAIAIPRDR